MTPNAKKLSVDQFINDPEVVQNIARLKVKFGEDLIGLQVSDTLDDDGHQYVNLVQMGGGVLGIALVGYTYILELAGIRFLRLAGTSAGAINTSLMVVIGEKPEAKSVKILDYLCQMDFFSFVDGHPFARWLIKNFVSSRNFTDRIAGFFKGLTISLVVMPMLVIAGLGLRRFYTWASPFTLVFCILSGLALLFLLFLLSYGFYLFGKLKASGYGVNPGVVFYDWVKARMEDNDVFTVSDLNKKAKNKTLLHLRNGGDVSDLFGDVTFISSELVTENKIQFPLMADLFRIDVDILHPARFVRASMAIPIFFESHIIDAIPCNDQKIKDAWFNHLKVMPAQIPDTARFVDGGMLSNFPINLFYNPQVVVPRMPVFGIDLDDSDPKRDTGLSSPEWSLGTYVWRLFNTIRYYYDKDFIEKNYVYQRGIGYIKLFGINWLNFFLTDEEKLVMFRKGVETAIDFLLEFNWEEYKNVRTDLHKKIEL